MSSEVTVRVTGQIIDKFTQKPAFGVEVGVAGSRVRATTDLRGRFELTGLPLGVCELQCSSDNYQPHTMHLTLAAGVTSCRCEIIPKERVPLTEPVALLPLRLELRKQTIKPIMLAEYETFTASIEAATFSLNSLEYQGNQPARDEPVTLKASFTDMSFPHEEYWLRWYPDDIHLLTPVGQIGEQEKEDWRGFYKVVTKEKAQNSIEEMYASEFGLSLELLEIYYGLRPGLLDETQFENCRLYDKKATELMRGQGQGLREALDWQDFANVNIKAAWLAFCDKYGVARARQIAKHMLEGNWDFDQAFLSVNYLNDLNQVQLGPELQEELRKLTGIVFDGFVVTIKESGKHWILKHSDQGDQVHLELKDDTILVTPDTARDPLSVMLDEGIPLPSLPTAINLYTVKGNALEILEANIKINKEALRVGPDDLESTRWLTDFSSAVKQGMGIKIKDVAKVKQIDEADWLIAVGMNDDPDSRTILEQILRRSHANGDLAIVSQDSPTNYTDKTQTPFYSQKQAEDYVKQTRMRLNRVESSEDSKGLSPMAKRFAYRQTDIEKFTNLFGLDNQTLSQLPEGQATDMIEAAAMAALLWEPLSHYFIHQHKPGSNQAVPNWEEWSRFFQNHVRARGVLPVLRFDEVPYGFLPVKTQGQQNAFEDFLFDLKERFLQEVNRVPKLDDQNEGTHDALLTQILRSVPVSTNIEVRHLKGSKLDERAAPLNCNLVRDSAVENPNHSHYPPFPDTAYLDEISRLDEEGFDSNCFEVDDSSPLLKRLLKYLLNNRHGVKDAVPPSLQIRVRTVQGKDIAGAKVHLINTNITGETNSGGTIVFDEDDELSAGVYTVSLSKSGFFPALIPNVRVMACTKVNKAFSLKAIKYVEDADNAGVADGIIAGRVLDNYGNAVAGARVSSLSSTTYVLTNELGNFELEKSDAGSILVNSEKHRNAYVDMATELSASAEVLVSVENYPPKAEDLVAEAANLLKHVHPDKLEILLLETLDLFSYRLDAWLTGLAAQQLNFRPKEKGMALGAFGWLEKTG